MLYLKYLNNCYNDKVIKISNQILIFIYLIITSLHSQNYLQMNQIFHVLENPDKCISDTKHKSRTTFFQCLCDDFSFVRTSTRCDLLSSLHKLMASTIRQSIGQQNEQRHFQRKTNHSCCRQPQFSIPISGFNCL